jgi:hypothetical protein
VDLAEGGEEGEDDVGEVLPRHFFPINTEIIQKS